MTEFSSVPPIPPPSGDVCPVCHAPFLGNPRLCPNCGVVLSQVSGGTSCWISLLSAFLILAALAFGGAGACLLLISTMEGSNTKDGLNLYGGAFVLAMIACIWAVFALKRRKKK